MKRRELLAISGAGIVGLTGCTSVTTTDVKSVVQNEAHSVQQALESINSTTINAKTVISEAEEDSEYIVELTLTFNKEAEKYRIDGTTSKYEQGTEKFSMDNIGYYFNENKLYKKQTGLMGEKSEWEQIDNTAPFNVAPLHTEYDASALTDIEGFKSTQNEDETEVLTVPLNDAPQFVLSYIDTLSGERTYLEESDTPVNGELRLVTYSDNSMPSQTIVSYESITGPDSTLQVTQHAETSNINSTTVQQPDF